DEVTNALRGATRVLTLTGPGGSGKTRLAIEAANLLADELGDGAFFVALDAIRDPALLLPTIAEAVAVKESGDRALPESPGARPRLLPLAACLALRDERLALRSRAPRNLPERHRALRDTAAWSYDLLGPDERALFAQLSVFGGGFTLESSVAVCNASLDGVAT